nr:hypothetical protein [Lachnospiraceae bacterium]
MQLKKLVSKAVLFAAALVATAGISKPVYADDTNFGRIEVEGTNEWNPAEFFSAEYTATSDPDSDIKCTVELLDGTEKVYSSYDNTGVGALKLDKEKTYTLNVYLGIYEKGYEGNSEHWLYPGKVDLFYFNNHHMSAYSSMIKDSYYSYVYDGTELMVTKKITYIPENDRFMAYSENLDLGDVTITGPASYKVGEVFDASKYSATSSKVKNLAVFAALQNEK